MYVYIYICIYMYLYTIGSTPSPRKLTRYTLGGRFMGIQDVRRALPREPTCPRAARWRTSRVGLYTILP